MADHPDARSWLRANGYDDVANAIDKVTQGWKERGVQTNRNWWSVLAGDPSGNPRTVGGFRFPVISAVRQRQGLAPVAGAIQRSPDEVAPTRVVRRLPTKIRVVRKPERKSASRPDEPLLVVRNFAQIEDVSVPLRDLVVLVGPQATGKSLILELLKLVLDRSRIVRSLKQHGFNWDSPEEFAALYFGGGFERAWTGDTDVIFDGSRITLPDVARARAYKGEDSVFYIPAHRTLAIGEGWPRSFAQYQVETPYVARRFSEELLTSLNQGLVGKGRIFPHDRRLKDAFRRLIDEAVYHGATLQLSTMGMRKQFELEYGHRGTTMSDTNIPFMAWTAGQREFTPMLLGLYHLLPAGAATKKKEIQWAVLEEPEMGLHPKAVVAVMAVVLDLLARGYKVALSTHSPTVLEVVWGMSRLVNLRDGAMRLCRMMGLPDREKKVLKTAADALKRTCAVVYLEHGPRGRVISKDISSLDPAAADDREGAWGGLTSFSTQVATAVARARA